MYHTTHGIWMIFTIIFQVLYSSDGLKIIVSVDSTSISSLAIISSLLPWEAVFLLLIHVLWDHLLKP
jgi:hypothetical protein